jgi:hypothetical protein
MTETIQTQLDALAELRLPDLQERFAELVGEETRCPNKTYLLRRIREALEAREAEPAPAPAEPAPAPTLATDESATEEDDVRLRDLDVEQLRARYVEVVGRATSSHDRRYLIWKIRQAEQGKVPVGPVGRRQPGDPPVEQKVLPLRMPAATVEALDEVWRRRGLKSRMDLFRHALDQYLTGIGEGDAADLVRGR